MESLQLYRQILESLYDGVYYVDRQRRIKYWNPAAERITGYRADEVIGYSCGDNLLRHVDDDGRELCGDHCPLQTILEGQHADEACIYLHHKDGYRVPVRVRAAPVLDEHGNVCGAVEIFSENLGQQLLFNRVKRLEKEVFQDALTRVGNRKYGEMKLQLSQQSLESYHLDFGILFLDLDHFKDINDFYGHATGDRVLVMVARTLENTLRPADICCRWGGEEFLLILANVDQQGLKRAAERLRRFIERSWFDSPRGRIQVTCSVGGALARPGEPLEQLIERADKRMYDCKDAGRNCVRIDEEA